MNKMVLVSFMNIWSPILAFWHTLSVLYISPEAQWPWGQRRRSWCQRGRSSASACGRRSLEGWPGRSRHLGKVDCWTAKCDHIEAHHCRRERWETRSWGWGASWTGCPCSQHNPLHPGDGGVSQTKTKTMILTMVTTVQWFDRIFQLTLMLIAQWTVRITAEIPNASTTSKQRKKRRLVWNHLLNLDQVEVVEPVVDGELHDGVAIEAGPEDLLLPPPHLLLCLLCGQLVVENLDVGKLWISEISLAGFLFSTFYIFLLSLKIPSLPVKLLIWQAVQFKELLR